MKIEKDTNSELLNSAKTLVGEIKKFGITCDTMASDRLHKFCKDLQTYGNDDEKKIGIQIENTDNRGTDRRKSIVLALLYIGSKFGIWIF